MLFSKENLNIDKVLLELEQVERELELLSGMISQVVDRHAATSKLISSLITQIEADQS